MFDFTQNEVNLLTVFMDDHEKRWFLSRINLKDPKDDLKWMHVFHTKNTLGHPYVSNISNKDLIKFLSLPLENMPLYVNIDDNDCHLVFPPFAQWRLRIGR